MATPLKIYPQFGSLSPSTPTPPWNGGYNLLFIHEAVGFDATKWRLDGALFSDAKQLTNGVHINIYPRQYGIVRIYQLDENGVALGGPTLLACDAPTVAHAADAEAPQVSALHSPTQGTGSRFVPRQ